MSQRVGLIAGGGDLPLEIARSAPVELFVMACRGLCEESIARLPSAAGVRWFDLSEAATLLTVLEAEGISQVVLAGKFDPGHVVRASSRDQADSETAGLLSLLSASDETTLMSTIVGVLASRGIDVLPQAGWLPHLVPGPGLLGKHDPTPSQLRDLAFGAPIARAMSASHAGQSIAVKDRAVVAIEALEGTDAMIDRAVALAGSGLTVIKCPRPDQDLRVDLPTIGPDTIDRLAHAPGSLLAVEAGTTLVLHRARCAERADRAGLALLAFDPADAAAEPANALAPPTNRKGAA